MKLGNAHKTTQILSFDFLGTRDHKTALWQELAILGPRNGHLLAASELSSLHFDPL